VYNTVSVLGLPVFGCYISYCICVSLVNIFVQYFSLLFYVLSVFACFWLLAVGKHLNK
jgi:uncharacterized membrane protein